MGIWHDWAVPVVRTVHKDFFKTWSDDMAYVLGFFAADGYMTVHRSGGQYWCIEIADKNLLYEIKRVIKSDHRISVRIRRKESKSILYRLQIGNREMCNDLRVLGFSERKTKSLAIPNIPDEYFPSFVRGYFDGDGNVWVGLIHKNRKTPLKTINISFTSCSKVFLNQLRDRLCRFGLTQGYIYGNQKNFSRLQYSIENSLKLFEIMYNTKAISNLYLQRKKGIFERYIALRA